MMIGTHNPKPIIFPTSFSKCFSPFVLVVVDCTHDNFLRRRTFSAYDLGSCYDSRYFALYYNVFFLVV